MGEHVFLLQRVNLIILASIEGLQEDVINFHDLVPNVLGNVLGNGVTIGNFNQIEDEELLRLIKQGHSLKRNTRYSLTCRDIGRVSKSAFLPAAE